MRYCPAFDGVRALAVLAVVAFHCKLSFAVGGMIGVDLFFVLSGFLITTILRTELIDTGKISLGRFYWRRALRLWPPLLMMLAAYGIAAPLMFPDANVVSDILLAGLYLSDYAMAFWGAPIELNHTWSLSVEEHFYLLWPLMILTIGRMAGRRIVGVFAAGFVLATIWRVADYLIWGDVFRTYFRFDTRMSGLILGGLIAVLDWRPGPRAATIIGYVSLSVLAIGLQTLRWKTPAPLLLGGLASDLASAGLILSLASGHATALGRVLSSVPLVYLGAISYSVYLWHYPITRLARDRFDPETTFLIVMSLSVAIAALSYEFVEKPLKAMRRRPPVPA